MRQFFALLAALVLSFSLASGATAQDSYRIKPGDQIRIEVLEDSNLNRDVLVLPDGRISVPLAGGVTAAGRTVEQVQAEIAGRLAPNFASQPSVFVTLSQVAPARAASSVRRTMPVYVLGEVNNPGKFEVAPGSTVIQVLAEIGGFSRFAATKRVQLRRVDPRSGQQSVYNIDYDAFESGGSAAAMTVMRAGDVLIVPQRKLFE